MLLRNSPNKHVPMYSVTWSWRNINISVIANKDPPCTSQQTSLLSSSSSSTTSSLSSLLQPAKAASCSPFLRLRPGRNGRRIMITTCPFFCPSVRLSVRLLPNLWTRYLENEWTEFDAHWHKCSTGQGHEMTIFGGQEVKGQGHTRPKIEVEGGLILDRLMSSKFSSFHRNFVISTRRSTSFYAESESHSIFWKIFPQIKELRGVYNILTRAV